MSSSPADQAVISAGAPPHPWYAWLPNALTLLRFVITAAFPFASPAWRAILVVAAAFSDFADGYFARRFNLTSWIGGLLDAIADKVFIITALATFLIEGRVQPWQPALLLTRDVCVAVVAVYVTVARQWSAFKDMSSRTLGKLTTACLFPYLILLALTPDEGVRGVIVFALCAGLSIAAGADYLVKFARAVRGRVSQEPRTQ